MTPSTFGSLSWKRSLAQGPLGEGKTLPSSVILPMASQVAIPPKGLGGGIDVVPWLGS
jgi:hypothetical protein